MAFIDVKNFKDALLQDMRAGLWDSYESLEIPDSSNTKEYGDYLKKMYYDSILNGELIGPVLIPNDTCSDCFWTMAKTLGVPSSYETNVKNEWNPSIELVNWSGTEKLYGEVSQGGVISVNNLFKNTLNESYAKLPNDEDGGFNLNVIRESEVKNDTYSPGLDRFKSATVNIVNTTTEFSIDKEILLQTMKEEYGTYKDASGKVYDSEFINLTPRETPTEDESIWSKPRLLNTDYIFKGNNVPRTKLTERNASMYVKFKCYDNTGGTTLTYYRYIPVFAFMGFIDNMDWLWRDWSNDTVTAFKQRCGANERTINGSFPYFAYQPFNMVATILTSDTFTLPPITFTNSKQMRYVQVQYKDSNFCVFINKNDLLQYMYLTGVRYIVNDEQDGELTPFYDLSNGSDTYSSNPGIPDNPESGATGGAGGTTTGGDKTPGDYTTPNVNFSEENKQFLLPPGIYGGIYIPTYRYVRTVTKNNYEKAVENINDIISNMENRGKGAAIVESFFHYDRFINKDKIQLDNIDVTVERPTYLCGYDKNSDSAYIPINNKLFIYPYCSMEINGYGQINELRFENFSQSVPTLKMVSKFQPGSTIFIYPVNYGGVKNNYDGGVAGQPLSILPYTKNDYMNEYNASQNSRSQAIQNINDIHAAQQIQTVVSGVMSAIGSGASTGQLMGGSGHLNGKTSVGTGGLMAASAGIGMGVGVVNTGTQLYSASVQKNAQLATFEAQLKDIENRPLAVANQNAAPSLPELITNSPAPFVVWKSIRKEFAEKIDIYFSKFGYKVSKFKEIDIYTRPRYNFIKCADCHVSGNIPQDELMKIKNIMESGITFWHDTRVGEYGNYTDNLAPVRNKDKYLKPSYMEV